MIAGADEAGRGPVLGPLVVAAVACEEEAFLREIGARDSKRVRPRERDAIAARIRSDLPHRVRVIPARELNSRMVRESLNEIETDAFAEVLLALAPDHAVVDACDVDATRFGAEIEARTGGRFPVTSEHKADANHPIVGAASILAKVERDAQVRAIEAEIGEPVGSGYPSDPVTRALLSRWAREHDDVPPHTRIYWSTVARDRPLDRKLQEFGKTIATRR